MLLIFLRFGDIPSQPPFSLRKSPFLSFCLAPISLIQIHLYSILSHPYLYTHPTISLLSYSPFQLGTILSLSLNSTQLSTSLIQPPCSFLSHPYLHVAAHTSTQPPISLLHLHVLKPSISLVGLPSLLPTHLSIWLLIFRTHQFPLLAIHISTQ